MPGKTKTEHYVLEHWRIADSARDSKKREDRDPLTISITSDAGNPLIVNGIVGGYDPDNTTITVWLTDEDGDQTFGTLDPNPPVLPNWTATFPELPDGSYTLTAQVQSDNEIVSQTVNVVFQVVAPPPPTPTGP